MEIKITTKEADELLDKYYEGLTSIAEENQLITFLKQKDLPERFIVHQAILGYFGKEKGKSHSIVIPFIRWVSIAAAVLLVLICIKSLTGQKQMNYTYINGERITDIRIVKANALSSLQEIASSPDEVQKSIDNLNDDNLVQ
jgi:hypothetical protein